MSSKAGSKTKASKVLLNSWRSKKHQMQQKFVRSEDVSKVSNRFDAGSPELLAESFTNLVRLELGRRSQGAYGMPPTFCVGTLSQITSSSEVTNTTFSSYIYIYIDSPTAKPLLFLTCVGFILKISVYAEVML